MGYHYLPCDRGQLYLMPPALQDWLPEGDLAWFILDAVAQMKLAAIVRIGQAGSARVVVVLRSRNGGSAACSTDGPPLPVSCFSTSCTHGRRANHRPGMPPRPSLCR
jgi:hypothetical protein